MKFAGINNINVKKGTALQDTKQEEAETILQNAELEKNQMLNLEKTEATPLRKEAAIKFNTDLLYNALEWTDLTLNGNNEENLDYGMSTGGSMVLNTPKPPAPSTDNTFTEANSAPTTNTFNEED